MSDEKKHICPSCYGEGQYYLEGNHDHNGGTVPCGVCKQKGWLTEAEQVAVEEARKEYNKIINGDPPRMGIFRKKLKGN